MEAIADPLAPKPRPPRDNKVSDRPSWLAMRITNAPMIVAPITM